VPPYDVQHGRYRAELLTSSTKRRWDVQPEQSTLGEGADRGLGKDTFPIDSSSLGADVRDGNRSRFGDHALLLIIQPVHETSNHAVTTSSVDKRVAALKVRVSGSFWSTSLKSARTAAGSAHETKSFT
jgi:hypothetical protein